MNPEQWNRVDEFFAARLLPRDEALEATLKSGTEAGLRAINVAPNQGKLLHLLARMAGAKRILEIGTLGGYSTIWLARALPADGVLVSLEKEPANAALARRNIEAAGLSAVASVVEGAAVESLGRLIAEKTAPFDFVFIDADKENNPNYLRLALQLSRPGTVIVADNVVRNGRVIDASPDDSDVEGVRRYLDLAAADPRLDTTAVQTVGSKGWDGFALTIVSG
ncbi:MAG: O-methyltransferase [Rhizobiales bacterium]|nr:O-methyltransferase [Hyphomicrobiales bacterium]OJY07502.1 MAG: methyltransferase [Rhizobiales bacterium 63-22]